jgi:hypothetical protein
VEMRVPWRDIAAALPDMTPLVSGKQARPWIRIQPITWDGRKQRIVDRGPSVASYRLVQTPYALDSALPERPRAPVPLALPVRGPWYVLQGPMGSFSHQNLWACDLARLNAAGHVSEPVDSKENADHFAWDQPVFTPIAGRVRRVRSDSEDGPAYRPVDANASANEVFISSQERWGLNLVHLRKGSVTVAVDDQVEAGQEIGRVGNSGKSDVPHLHVAIWPTWQMMPVPVAFRNVRVRLNLPPGDSWARDLPTWEPRRGYFVEALPIN